jgi:acetylglutamate/LysW-gamma-L-alpha-aminoadipate kinase
MLLIKVGGGDQINLEGIAADVAGLSEPMVLVHGANSLRDRLATQLDVPIRRVTSVSGYVSVVSETATVDVMMMAYAGLRNKRFVELLQRHGVNAVGLSGVDGCTVQGRRNRGIRMRENGKLKLMRDLSGRARSVNTELLDLLLANRFTPVLTMPILDEKGVAVSSENDDVVTLLQAAYRTPTVIQLIEAPGLLADPDDDTTHLRRLSRIELAAWEERASGRLRRKLRAIRNLLDGIPARILIGDGRADHPVLDALDEKGTVIQ